MLQDNQVGIPHQITPGNLLMLARNEAVPFETRVEATLRLHQELPFVPDHLRGKYAAEISQIRAELQVGEIPKEASEMGIADEFAKLAVQVEDLTARVDKLEAIVLDLAAPKKLGPSYRMVMDKDLTQQVEDIVAAQETTGANHQGAATSLTVQNGIVTGVK